MEHLPDVDLSNMDVLSELEASFVSALDATDVYVCAYERLHARLKEVGTLYDSCPGNESLIPSLTSCTLWYRRGTLSWPGRDMRWVFTASAPSQFASHLEASRRVGVENNDTDGPFSLLGEEQDLCTSQKGRSMSLSRNPTQSKEGELLG